MCDCEKSSLNINYRFSTHLGTVTERLEGEKWCWWEALTGGEEEIVREQQVSVFYPHKKHTKGSGCFNFHLILYHKAFSDSVTGVGWGRVFSIFCAPVCPHARVPRFLTEEKTPDRQHHNVKTYPCWACFPAHNFTVLFYSQYSFFRGSSVCCKSQVITWNWQIIHLTPRKTKT